MNDAAIVDRMRRLPATESRPTGSVTAQRRALAAVAFVYLCYCSFGIAHPVLWGHYGFHTAEYFLRALRTLRFGDIVPISSPGYLPPLPAQIYLHHPIGYHHIYVPLIALWGNHAWIGALVPALSGLLVLWAIYSLVQCFWGPRAAVLAAAVWVALPFVWTFSILTDPMFPAMACSIATIHALLHYLQSPSRRRLAHAALFTAIGALLFWEAFLQTGLSALLLAGWWRRGSVAARPERRRAALAWIGVTSAVCAGALAFHAFLVVRHHAFADLRKSYASRGHDALLHTIGQNGYWLVRLYGPLIEALGLLWLVRFATRARRGEARPRDLAVLMFAVINLVYIALFPNAANVHMYRVFWFSTSFVLAIVDLADELRDRLERRHASGGMAPRRGMAFALALLAAGVLPQSVYNLIEGRAMMGTHVYEHYDADYARQQFAAEVNRLTTPGDVIVLHANVRHRSEFLYVLDRSVIDLVSLQSLAAATSHHPGAILLTDVTVGPAERALLDQLIAAHPATRFEHWWMIDLGRSGPATKAYGFVPAPMSWAWWWFVSHRYPPLRAAPRG